ncbi:alpha/beta hydrolase [Halobaculum sp. CBA1158]|uniref:alpha/beta fold hydrolase n=1 Tax=Halobaculum sp. CBA1158 TaxID=2904243 RepID=UPI001F2C8D6D|nr:alpha/beta hydrolase [Halobaculum sp. CBA1158]UIP00789.1 alpha/beta hydrolase [Halobaculum sp. CBA1158]
MTLRSTLASTAKYAALGAGVAVAATRALRAKAGGLEPPLEGVQRTYRWRGMDVAYTEAGDADDETIVLLHGINAAGSAGEWREVFVDLSREYHVVAPDLPGFGRSDRPSLRYSAALYEDFVRDFLSEYPGARVVASSLTGAYVAGVAGDLDIADLTLVCPTAVAGPEPPKTAVRELLRAPVIGEAAFALLASRPSIRYFNADHGYWDPEKAGEDWPDYEWRTTHQPGARFAPASFISGHLNSDVDLASALAGLDAPTTIVWGREADLPPLATGRDLADDADCELIVFDDAMLLPHVEFGDEFVSVVAGDRPEGTVSIEQQNER